MAVRDGHDHGRYGGPDGAGARDVLAERGEGRPEDDAATARYARRLLAQMGIDPGKFTLWADGGTLFIRGLVPTKTEAARIQRMLARLDGVQEVEALLPVDPAAEIYTGWGGKRVH